MEKVQITNEAGSIAQIKEEIEDITFESSEIQYPQGVKQELCLLSSSKNADTLMKNKEKETVLNNEDKDNPSNITLQALPPPLLYFDRHTSQNKQSTSNKQYADQGTPKSDSHDIPNLPGDCPIGCGKSNCLDHFFSPDYYEDWRKTRGTMVSQLGNIFSENNLSSSDEDEDAIHFQVNKMRQRNGLRFIDCRRKSKIKNKKRTYVAPNYKGDGSSRSSPELIVDESAEEITDTDSVISISSDKSNHGTNILNKDLYNKVDKNDSIKTGSTNFNRSVLKSNCANTATPLKFHVVKNSQGSFELRPNDEFAKRTSKNEQNSNHALHKPCPIKNTLTSGQNSIKQNNRNEVKQQILKQHTNSTNVTNNISSRNVEFQNIATVIQNMKNESDVSISEDQSNNLNISKPKPVDHIFQCIPCKIQFKTHFEFKKHILSAHIRIYQCFKCPFRTLMPFQLQKHLLTHNSSKSSESNNSLSPLRIKQLSSNSTSSPTSSRADSPIEIIEID